LAVFAAAVQKDPYRLPFLHISREICLAMMSLAPLGSTDVMQSEPRFNSEIESRMPSKISCTRPIGLRKGINDAIVPADH
jgi:hypothetical protein